MVEIGGAGALRTCFCGVTWICIRHFHRLFDRRRWARLEIAFAHVEIWEVPRWLRSAPPALRDRLRGVTWTGNLLVCGFVVGLGTWSTYAPLESAAIAIGTVESEFEPQDDSAP